MICYDKLWLMMKQIKPIIESNDFSIKSICSFAKKFNVHPAIIVGRLQHKKIIPFTKDTNLFEKIDLFN